MKYLLSFLLLISLTGIGQNPYTKIAKEAADKTNLDLIAQLAKQRIDRWANMVDSKDLSADEFKFLVKSQLDILEMARIRESLNYTKHFEIPCDHVWLEIPVQSSIEDTIYLPRKAIGSSETVFGVPTRFHEFDGNGYLSHWYICLVCHKRFRQVIQLRE